MSSAASSSNLANLPPLSKEQFEKRIESLVQENRVFKIEIDTYKLRVKALQEENKELRKASVNIQVRAEQEEEYISNKLLKKIQSLKKEKETLANNYEREEEYLTNDLSRKLHQLRNEKVQLEQTLEQEQEHMVNKLMRKIEKLEAETNAKQSNLEQLRREKIELENTLEQEQESLVNRLWKRMERLEAEKRLLQEKLDQPVSAPMSPRGSGGVGGGGGVPTALALNSNPPGSLIGTTLNLGLGLGSQEQASNLTEHIINLRREVSRLKANLEKTERDHKENISKIINEEKTIREENIRLQRRLQMEVDRREALCRHLSESESSLEMDDERHFNESSRVRTISSPVPGYVGGVANSSNQNTSMQNCPGSISEKTSQNTNSNNMMFSQPLSHQLTTSAANLANTAAQERCSLCNQLKPVNLNTSQQSLLNSTSPPPSMLTSSGGGHNSRHIAQPERGGSSGGFNALTASSSLSSSSSSLNSNFNKIPQLNPINATQTSLTGSTSSNMEVTKK
jgi:coiled-coil domain-containing protein 6